MSHIVQAEFFHVGGGVGINYTDVIARINDNLELVLAGFEPPSGIKTVVRFYDDTGVITSAVSHLSALNIEYMRTIGLHMQERGLRQWFLGRSLNTLALQVEHQKRRCQMLAVSALNSVVNAKAEVAVERSDHSFRYAKADEYYDLLTSVKKAKGVWLFIFKENHILSDENTAVVYMM